MKRALYEFLRWYVRIGLKCYFRKIEINGSQHFPAKDQPVLITANHQNAFLDALLIVCFTSYRLHFLTRAGIFSNKVVTYLLNLINLIPIYRMRDGKKSLANNEVIFRRCYKLLEKGDQILIFPEGNHGHKRNLRPLSKGFTRISFGAIENTGLNDLLILPVGINYSHHQKFRASVSMYIGPPLHLENYNAEDPMGLRNGLSMELRKLIVHIPEDNYAADYKKLKEANADFTKPVEINRSLKGGDIPVRKDRKPSLVYKLLHYISVANLFVVSIIWKSLLSKIKDPVFVGSIKFVYGIFVVPFLLLLQALVVAFFFSWYIGAVYLIFSVFLVFFLPKE